jgi:hypothetical protein
MQTLMTLYAMARPSWTWAAGRLAEARRSSMLRRTIGGALASLLLMAALVVPAGAARGIDVNSTADGSLVDVQILVDGRVQPLYFGPNGFDRHYFQAFKGRSYEIGLTNNTGRRIGVLLAVDGINAVNGERSRLASSEPMYVLDPWEHTVIRGWRSSLDQTHQFVFVDEERSYASRTDQANGDLGWIRVLAFNERGARIKDSPRVNGREWDGEPFGSREEGGTPEARRDAPAPAPAPSTDGVAPRAWGNTKQMYGSPSNPDAAPGTGWGQQQWDPVRRVWFVPEWRASDQVVLRYEYAAGLRALGIPIYYGRRVWDRDRGQLGFAQPPRW